MGASLYHLSFPYNNDGIGVLYSWQAMCNHKRCPANTCFIQRLLDNLKQMKNESNV